MYQHYVTSLDELMESGAQVIDSFGTRIGALAADTHGRAHCAPLKSVKRAKAKAQYKYKDPDGPMIAWYRLTDLVRATIEYPDLDAMYAGLRAVLGDFGKEVRELGDGT